MAILPGLGCDSRAALRARLLRRPQIIPAGSATPSLQRTTVAMPEQGGGDGKCKPQNRQGYCYRYQAFAEPKSWPWPHADKEVSPAKPTVGPNRRQPAECSADQDVNSHFALDQIESDSPPRNAYPPCVAHDPHNKHHNAHHEPGPLRDSSGSGWGKRATHRDILPGLGRDGRAALRARLLRRPQIIPARQTTPRLHRASVAVPEEGGGDGGEGEYHRDRKFPIRFISRDLPILV